MRFTPWHSWRAFSESREATGTRMDTLRTDFPPCPLQDYLGSNVQSLHGVSRVLRRRGPGRAFLSGLLDTRHQSLERQLALKGHATPPPPPSRILWVARCSLHERPQAHVPVRALVSPWLSWRASSKSDEATGALWTCYSRLPLQNSLDGNVQGLHGVSLCVLRRGGPGRAFLPGFLGVRPQSFARQLEFYGHATDRLPLQNSLDGHVQGLRGVLPVAPTGDYDAAAVSERVSALNVERHGPQL